jgi:porin
MTPTLTLKGGVMENPQASSRSHAGAGRRRAAKGSYCRLKSKRPLINGLPGAYNLGVVFTNAPQTDLYRGKSGGRGDGPGFDTHNRTWFMYAGLNQQLTQHQDDPNRGLSTSQHEPCGSEHNYMHQVYAASLRYRGLFDATGRLDWLWLTWIDMSSQ